MAEAKEKLEEQRRRREDEDQKVRDKEKKIQEIENKKNETTLKLDSAMSSTLSKSNSWLIFGRVSSEELFELES
jgi:uncharacterized protein (UPF0218 family)